jgi:hypothetical protein
MCDFLYLTLMSRLSVVLSPKRAEIQSLLFNKRRYEMKLKKYYFSVIFIVIFILASGLSFADEARYKKTIKFKVTITNLTRGQVFSPPIAMGHDGKFRLFKLGEEASDELAALAEGGDTGPLVDLIKGRYPYAVAGDAIPPGGSGWVILEISKRDRLRFISVAGMLVSTNDAFFAARDVWFLGRRNVIVEAAAYDAGSEINNEECKDIPGPPCGDPNEHPDVEAEGYVHVHAGIYGIAPIVDEDAPRLVPAERNWNNPVAKITIRRIYY